MDDIRYFEDFTKGQVFVSRDYLVEKSEIVSFASMYDPQSFHTGNKGIETVPPLYDVLTCTGYHISAICMRLLVDTVLLRSSCLSSPGLEYVKWPNPIREGDVVHAMFTVIDTRDSSSKPNLGIVKILEQLHTKGGLLVCEMVKIVFFAKRQPHA